MLATLFLKLYMVVLKKIKTPDEYKDVIHKVVNSWADHVLKVIGVKVDIIGIENIPKEECLFVSNHQGNADFLLLMAKLDKHLGFIAKKELLKIKIVSMWMKEMHCVFLDRDNIRESLKGINEGAENLKNGYSMVIFPEGHRSKSHKLGEFKKGSMKLAVKAGVPVVPLVVDNTFKVFEEKKGRLTKTKVTLSILKPIDVKTLTKEEKTDLAEIVREKIDEELKKIVIQQ
jgi:1-acyl-sn-glycerol-3-phosphate acyltransferase